MGGTICTITAFSSAACALLASQEAAFEQGACTIVPHGKFESTIQTKLGPKRLVRVVGIDENSTDSGRLAAHFTIEDDGATAATYPPCPAGENVYTLAERVIARCIVAFRNGGWDSCISPTIESLVARRDHHGHGLTSCLFSEVEKWFLHDWMLDVKEGGRMLQATQLGNFVVDGVPKPGGGGGGGGAGETGPYGELTFVTDKQLLYNMLGFLVNTPGEGSIWEILSANHREEDEGMKMYPPAKVGASRLPRQPEAFPDYPRAANYPMAEVGMGWRSCDSCLTTETKNNPLRVCSGCLCDKYFAARYCR